MACSNEGGDGAKTPNDIESFKGSCALCVCTQEQSHCVFCTAIRFQCEGTCRCCEISRLIRIQNRILNGHRATVLPSNGEIQYLPECQTTQSILQQRCSVGSTPINETQTIPSIGVSVENPTSKNNGSRPNDEELMDTSPSNGVNCNMCLCNLQKSPCTVCVNIQFSCEGTCDCCDLNRNIQAILRRNNNQQESNLENIVNVSNFGPEKVAVLNSPHRFCFCQPYHSLPCFYCFLKDFRCGGACKCCPRFLLKQAALHKKLGLKENVQKNLPYLGSSLKPCFRIFYQNS